MEVKLLEFGCLWLFGCIMFDYSKSQAVVTYMNFEDLFRFTIYHQSCACDTCSVRLRPSLPIMYGLHAPKCTPDKV